MLEYSHIPHPKSFINAQFSTLLHNKYHSYSTIYTDGSKTTHGTSSALHSNDHEATYSLHKSTGIFTAELFAILKATEYINTRTASKWIIASDSLNSIRDIASYIPKHPLAEEIKNNIHRLHIKNKTVLLVWTPGHSGISGNEKADLLTRTQNTNNLYANYVFWSRDLDNQSRSSIRDVVQLEWDLLPGDNKLQSIKTLYYSKEEHSELNRGISVKLCRLRIGHTLMTHKHLIDKTNPPVCQSCNTSLTIKHIFQDCPLYLQMLSDCNLEGSLANKLSYKNADQINNFLQISSLYKQI